MIALAAEDLADLRRWAICGAVVVLAYGGLAAGLVTWHEPVEGTGAAAGIVIEFAPMPVAPATVQSEVRPGPEMDTFDSPPTQQVEAKREQKVEEKVESKPVEERPPEVPNPEAAILDRSRGRRLRHPKVVLISLPLRQPHIASTRMIAMRRNRMQIVAQIQRRRNASSDAVKRPARVVRSTGGWSTAALSARPGGALAPSSAPPGLSASGSRSTVLFGQ
jgi:hypothetical protein